MAKIVVILDFLGLGFSAKTTQHSCFIAKVTIGNI